MFSARDQYGHYFDLKRLIAYDDNAYEAAMEEIRTLKEVSICRLTYSFIDCVSRYLFVLFLIQYL